MNLASRIGIGAAVLLALGAVVLVKAHIIRDCGWLGLLKGAEWFWIFGGCK